MSFFPENKVTLNYLNVPDHINLDFLKKKYLLKLKLRKCKKAFQTVKTVSAGKDINYSAFNYQSQKVINFSERLTV